MTTPITPPISIGAIDASRVPTLHRQFKQLVLQGGYVMSSLLREALACCDFVLPELPGGVQTVLLAGVFEMPVKVAFKRGGRDVVCFLPADYFNPGFEVPALMAAVRQWHPALKDAQLMPVNSLPLKVLAVSSGIARYGRNNLAYVKGMGSFSRLFAFVTNARGVDCQWRFPQTLAACQDCSLCSVACPTRAIPDNRFLLHAGRCLTLYNEQPGEFPEWIQPSAHNAVMGCMRCQWVCPENRVHLNSLGFLARFDEYETDLILNGEPGVPLPQVIQDKLRRQGMPGSNDASVWARNLQGILGYLEGKGSKGSMWI